MRVCIIGAGLSGLNAARYLSEFGKVKTTIVERLTLAGGRATWRTGRSGGVDRGLPREGVCAVDYPPVREIPRGLHPNAHFAWSYVDGSLSARLQRRAADACLPGGGDPVNGGPVTADAFAVPQRRRCRFGGRRPHRRLRVAA